MASARRGFTAALAACAALTVLAAGSHAGGKNEGADEPMAIAMAAAKKANLQGLRDALMPLLVYVKGGQPRDALRAMADGTGAPVSPAMMESLQDGVKIALDGLGKMPVTGGDAARSRDAARIATELYGEAISIAGDAGATTYDQSVARTMGAAGVRLLGLGDALFDQSRRLSGGTFGRSGDITVNTPAPVPDLDPKANVKPGDEKAITRALARKVRFESEALGANAGRAVRLSGIADRLLELAN